MSPEHHGPPVSQRVDRQFPFAGRTIVVADDEPDEAKFLATVFEDRGATVRQAANGDEAFAMVHSERPDLLTLDLAMPGRNAGEVFEAFRNDPDLDGLKICIITGRPELRGLIYQRSVRPPEGFLVKPVTEDVLTRAVRKILELSHST